VLPFSPRRLLTIRPDEASFSKRGFEPGDSRPRRQLEGMLGAFIAGHNLAVMTPDFAQLVARLHRGFDDHHVGFAFEGVGLHLAALDLLTPWRRSRLKSFVEGVGQGHDYIVAVGAGFAAARMPWSVQSLNRLVLKIDPLLAWCIPCGYGFHQGFFHHRQYIDAAAAPPSGISDYGNDLFDSGLGRSLWWVKCADPNRIKCAIDGFPNRRRAELWAGIGIAAAYAGGLDAGGLLKLYRLSDSFQFDFLSGLPFAARLRQKGNNPSEATELACQTLLEMSADQTADWALAAAESVGTVRGTGITAAYTLARQKLVSQCKRFVGIQVH
jgi:enediyne biosynthesis protein E3